MLELIKDILKTLKELRIMSYAITITATILGVTILVIGATTNQARADYGCVQEPSTNSTTGPYICLDLPTSSNIWKAPEQLNATGQLHGTGIIYVYLNNTVTFTPTPECKKDNDMFKNISAYNDSMVGAIAGKCAESVFEWNQIHPENIVIEPGDQQK